MAFAKHFNVKVTMAAPLDVGVEEMVTFISVCQMSILFYLFVLHLQAVPWEQGVIKLVYIQITHPVLLVLVIMRGNAKHLAEMTVHKVSAVLIAHARECLQRNALNVIDLTTYLAASQTFGAMMIEIAQSLLFVIFLKINV